MFKSFISVALVGAATAITQAELNFMQYISKQGKSYTNIDEFNQRLALFSVTDKIIAEWNSDLSNTSRMGHNFISDYTEAEKAKLRGLTIDAPMHTNATMMPKPTNAVPTSVNWVTQGNVGPVKDQGQCGSCWAFSATGTVESSISIAKGTSPVSLSEQQLVSCSSAYNNAGCGGGWYYWAWNYVEVYGQEKGSDYPYTSGKTTVDGTCYYDASKRAASVTSYVQVGQTNEEIKAAIAIKPVSVALDAAKAVFQQYTSGVVTASCGIMLDHAVIAVGYGSESGQDYFLVRNSWGSSWGDQGYIKIGTSSTDSAPGVCGINKAVYYPITA